MAGMPAAGQPPLCGLRSGAGRVAGRPPAGGGCRDRRQDERAEFTLEGYTTNLLFGTTRNPVDTRLTPGGSSGGARARVAPASDRWRSAPMARLDSPARQSHGLVGLKTSIGRVAPAPACPQILLDLETIGPIARTVEDVALAMAVIGGATCSTAARRPRRWTEARRAAALALRTPLRRRAVDPAILASTDAAAAPSRRWASTSDEGPLPFDITPVVEMWPVLGQVVRRTSPDCSRAGTTRSVTHACAGRGGPRHSGDPLPRRDRVARRLPAHRHSHFHGRRLDHDAIGGGAAVAADDPFPPVIDGQSVGPRGHAVFTAWVNACGHPALALPSSPSPAGLPIGFQLVGPLGADDLLLELGARSRRRSLGGIAGRRLSKASGESDPGFADACMRTVSVGAGRRLDHAAPGSRRDDVAGAQRRAPRACCSPTAAAPADRRVDGADAVERDPAVDVHFAAHRGVVGDLGGGAPLPTTSPALTCESASFHSAGASR